MCSRCDDGFRAVDVEVTLAVAEVRRIAIRGREQRAHLRAQPHRVLEAREVVDAPRRDHEHGREHGRTEPLDAHRARLRAGEHRERQRDERHQQHELRTRERARAGHCAERRETLPTRPAPVLIREQYGQHREEHRERFGLQRAVGRPDARVQRGEPGSDEPRARAGDLAADDPDEHDRRGAEEARPQHVREHAVHAEQRRDCQEDEIQRRVFGGLLVNQRVRERLDEALAVGQQVRALVVEARIAARHEVAPLDQHVRDAHREAADGDRGERPHEPPRAAARVDRHRNGGGSTFGPMNVAAGRPRFNISWIFWWVVVGSFASASMNRLSSTCGTRSR